MSINPSLIQALCFDVDGTLRDTDDQFVQLLSTILRPTRFLLPQRDESSVARRLIMGMENPGTYLHGLTDRLDIDSHLVQLTEYFYGIRRIKNSHPAPLIAGVEELLMTLSQHFPLAVVSARSERSTLEFLHDQNIRRFFNVVVAGQTCRHTKPYPDPVLFAADRMGVSPKRCLMIGDTIVDIRAGRLAGAQTVGVLCGFGEEEELRREGADLILTTTPMLVDHLLT